jgi:hypothetical protein
MAIKKDDDKSKRTLSGKKPATFGGANSKLISSKPKAKSSVMVAPSRPMDKNVTGESNFNRTSPSRTTVSVGYGTFPMGGKTSKSSGGMDMSKGEEKYIKKKGSKTKPSNAKSGGSNSSGWQTATQLQETAAQQKAAGKKSGRIGAGLITLFGGLGAAYTLNKNKEERREKRAERKATKAAKKSGVMVVEKGTKTK